MKIKFISLFDVSFKLYEITKTYFKQQNITSIITHNYYNIFNFYNKIIFKDLITSIVHNEPPLLSKNDVFDSLIINDRIYTTLLDRANNENYIVLDSTHNFINIANSFYNLKQYNIFPIYSLFNLSDFKFDIIKVIQTIVNTIEYNDFFCISLYRNPEIHLLFAILLKKKYPTCRIIAGGLYQHANLQPIVDYFKYFDIEWYFGDVHIVLENLVNNNMNNSMFIESYDNNPLYISNNKYMYVNFSRGCLNCCNYCVGHYLGKYTRMSINKIEKWFKIINKTSIEYVAVLDNELNLCNDWFNEFLDMVLANNFKFTLSFYIFVNKLSKTQIAKLNKINVKLWCNIDSSGKSVNRKDSFTSLKNLVYLHNMKKNMCEIGYISNCIHISKEQFDRDIMYLKYFHKKNIPVTFAEFSLHTNSNFFKYKDKFNIDVLYYKDMQSIAHTEDNTLNNILDNIPVFYKHDLNRQIYNERTSQIELYARRFL